MCAQKQQLIRLIPATPIVTSMTQGQQLTPYKRIQVHCVCGNDSSRERLRNKIAESQQRRLSSMKVNWSALKAA